MSEKIKKNKCRNLGTRYQAWVSEEDKGFLMGSVHTTHTCGCRVIGNGTLLYPLSIEFCKEHRRSFTMIEDDEKAAGEALVKILKLRKDPVYKDRYQLGCGYLNKTALGVWRTVRWLVEKAVAGEDIPT